jgi:hypothetical protein
LIKAKKLTALDALVLGMLLRERRFSESSPVSRCTKEKIASELGKSPSAIQSSFARLKACGLIEHVCVGKPDPNDATNHTGYRVFFPFVNDGKPYRSCAPRRVKNAPPGDAETRPQGMQKHTNSPYAPLGTRAEFKAEREKDDDDAVDSTRPVESSSSSDLPIPIPIEASPTPGPVLRIPLVSAMPALTPRVPRIDPMAASGPAFDLALFTALVLRAASLLKVSPETARVELERKTQEFSARAGAQELRFGLSWLTAALDAAEAHNRKSGNLPVRGFGFLGATLNNFLLAHGPPPPPPAKPHPKPDRPPPRPGPVNQAEPFKRCRPGYLAELMKAHAAGDQARIAALEAEAS